MVDVGLLGLDLGVSRQRPPTPVLARVATRTAIEAGRAGYRAERGASNSTGRLSSVMLGSVRQVPLDKYRSMRDFAITPEPDDPAADAGEQSDRAPGAPPRFVVQEHHATALHWDFRLERDGVLAVSWAVPKGIPPDPRVNHMAVHTEDHPLSYFDFEGAIPKDEYGGGTVRLWDQGTYDEEKFSEREVMVVLHGRRARGRHVLFKTDGKNWMMHRMDPPEDPSRELVPSDARPAVSTPGPLPTDPDWRFEALWGGDRVALTVDGGRCTAVDSTGLDVTKRWPELGAFGRAVGALPVVFEAQIVRPSKGTAATVFLSDLQWLDGHATTTLAFEQRRHLLEGLELDADGWRTAPLYEDGSVLQSAVEAQGLPGLLARKLDGTYGDRLVMVAVGR